jgi:hypothetical protein
MRLRCLAFGICGLLAVAAAAFGQERTGGIAGTVKDSSGAILPGATITATSPSLVGVQTALADHQGNYRFPALTPGVYEITATLQGFTVAKATDVRLGIGQLLKIDLALSVATLTESVTVTAESPVIDVKQNAAVSTITSEEIERLPKARDFTDMVKTAPGTQQERKSGIQIDGAGGSEHRYVIDGLDTTGIRTGVSGQEMPVDFIEAVQVKSSGYNAEFRATTGGVISAVTKTGSNVWRGGVGYYFRNDNQPARRELRQLPTDASQAEYITRPEDDYVRHEPTFDLGGPILKNRAWFYVGFAPEIDRTTRTGDLSHGRHDRDLRPERERLQHDCHGDRAAQFTDAAQGHGQPAVVEGRAGTHRERRRLPDDRAGRHQHIESDALPEPDLPRHVRQLLRRRAGLGAESEAVCQHYGRHVRLRHARRRRG